MVRFLALEVSAAFLDLQLLPAVTCSWLAHALLEPSLECGERGEPPTSCTFWAISFAMDLLFEPELA